MDAKHGTICVLLVVALLAPKGAPAATADLVRRADALFAERDAPGKAQEALEAYEMALALDDENPEVLWRLARAHFWLGMQEDSADQFREAIEFAKLCKSVADGNAGCHFWLGASYGKFGEARGVLQSLYLVPFVQEEFERVIELDRAFEKAGADLGLGRMYFLIPEAMPGRVKGDKGKALAHLAKVVELAPDNLLGRVWLAEALLDRGARREARGHLEAVIAAPRPRDPQPRGIDPKAEARRLLDDL